MPFVQWTEVLDKFEKAASYLCSSSLTQILGVSLGEFGQNMKSVGVSATNHEGIDAFLMAIEASSNDYNMRTYKYSSNQYIFLLLLNTFCITPTMLVLLLLVV